MEKKKVFMLPAYLMGNIYRPAEAENISIDNQINETLLRSGLGYARMTEDELAEHLNVEPVIIANIRESDDQLNSQVSRNHNCYSFDELHFMCNLSDDFRERISKL